MKSIIINQEDIEELPDFVLSLLPESVAEEIRGLSFVGDIEEIRLRRERCAMLTLDGRTVILSSIVSSEEMELTLSKMCDGSLYAHRDTICRGYISLKEGVRVGISGRAALDGDKIIGVYDVSSLVIRIPHTVEVDTRHLCELIESERSSGGMLIFSPPGVGKTTLLRALAKELSSGENPRRVAVVDTRGELSYCLSGKRNSLDILSGYPKDIGIDIATRTLNAEIIICDEIGRDETDAILSSQNSGARIIATTHGADAGELILRSGIRRLHENRAFFAYVGIRRRESGGFTYEITRREDFQSGV